MRWGSNKPLYNKNVLTLARNLGREWTRNPNMWSPYLRAISSKTEIISITSLVLFKNSSDLDSGRRPELKSDEFLKSTKLVIEIQRCENGAFPKRGYTYWDFESPRRRASGRIVRCAGRTPPVCGGPVRDSRADPLYLSVAKAVAHLAPVADDRGPLSCQQGVDLRGLH